MKRIGYYTNLDSLKTHDLHTVATKDDSSILRCIREASADFEFLCFGRRFYPILDTKYYDYKHSYHIHFDNDLLELISFTTNNGFTNIDLSGVVLRNGSSNHSGPPFTDIYIDTMVSSQNFTYRTTPVKANAITGLWGYCENWSGYSFIDTLSTVTSATTNIINLETSGVNEMGLTPKFSPYMILKIVKDDNFEFVIVISVGEDTITCIRGANGTPIIADIAGATVFQWQPMESVEKAVRRLAAWYYRQKDTTREMERPMMTNVGIAMPPKFPEDVANIAKGFRDYKL